MTGLTIAQLKDLNARSPDSTYHLAVYQGETSWVAAFVIDGEAVPIQTKRGQIKAYRHLDSLCADLRRVFGDQRAWTFTLAPAEVTSMAALKSCLDRLINLHQR
jgi:hypothetical protein